MSRRRLSPRYARHLEHLNQPSYLTCRGAENGKGLFCLKVMACGVDRGGLSSR